MSDKVYEMDDNYNQGVADLLEFIKERDELAETIKFAPPEKIREAQKLLAELNKAIEEGEAALAKEYEAYQKQRRAENDLDEKMEEMLDRVVKVFIHVKYNNPEMFEAVKEKALAVWVEREEEFYDRVAMYEADKTEFEKIIARENNSQKHYA
jgi:hypothetical protein